MCWAPFIKFCFIKKFLKTFFEPQKFLVAHVCLNFYLVVVRNEELTEKQFSCEFCFIKNSDFAHFSNHLIRENLCHGVS